MEREHTSDWVYNSANQKKLLSAPTPVFLFNRHPDLILPPVGVQIPNVLCGSPLLTPRKKLKKDRSTDDTQT